MSKKAMSLDEPKNLSKRLVRSNATCGDDDNVSLKPVRLINSQTKPALSTSVSKDSSTGFTDVTETDLHSFILQTLHKNSKDRNLILDVEKKLVDLLKDDTRQSFAFDPMSSYERMIVHRVAAYFGLDHNVSQDGSYVIACKTNYAKRPAMSFSELIKDDNFTEPAIKPGPRSYCNFQRPRRHSQNVDNLTCAMTALSFSNDNQVPYKYSMRSDGCLQNQQNVPMWMPASTPMVMDPRLQGQNFAYFPNNQVNTNFVPIPNYQNLGQQPTQSNQPFNFYQVPAPYYFGYPPANNYSMFRPVEQLPKNVQTSP